MPQLIESAAKNAGTSEEYNHPFYRSVKEIVEAGDIETLNKEKIPLKLLRLAPEAQEGFILQDYPLCQQSAELMEEYKGGLNAFVHVSLPDHVLMNIEQGRYKCEDCNRSYYSEEVSCPENGIHIPAFMPEDGHCDDCGSVNIVKAEEDSQFAAELAAYYDKKDELLSIYNHLGNLVDFELRGGYESYDQLKKKIQHNIKH